MASLLLLILLLLHVVVVVLFRLPDMDVLSASSIWSLL
jgi:hypothetical protein